MSLSFRSNSLHLNEATRNNQFIQKNENNTCLPVPDWLAKLRKEKKLRLQNKNQKFITDHSNKLESKDKLELTNKKDSEKNLSAIENIKDEKSFIIEKSLKDDESLKNDEILKDVESLKDVKNLKNEKKDENNLDDKESSEDRKIKDKEIIKNKKPGFNNDEPGSIKFFKKEDLEKVKSSDKQELKIVDNPSLEDEQIIILVSKNEELDQKLLSINNDLTIKDKNFQNKNEKLNGLELKDENLKNSLVIKIDRKENKDDKFLKTKKDENQVLNKLNFDLCKQKNINELNCKKSILKFDQKFLNKMNFVKVINQGNSNNNADFNKKVSLKQNNELVHEKVIENNNGDKLLNENFNKQNESIVSFEIKNKLNKDQQLELKENANANSKKFKIIDFDCFEEILNQQIFKFYSTKKQVFKKVSISKKKLMKEFVDENEKSIKKTNIEKELNSLIEKTINNNVNSSKLVDTKINVSFKQNDTAVKDHELSTGDQLIKLKKPLITPRLSHNKKEIKTKCIDNLDKKSIEHEILSNKIENLIKNDDKVKIKKKFGLLSIKRICDKSFYNNKIKQIKRADFFKKLNSSIKTGVDDFTSSDVSGNSIEDLSNLNSEDITKSCNKKKINIEQVEIKEQKTCSEFLVKKKNHDYLKSITPEESSATNYINGPVRQLKNQKEVSELRTEQHQAFNEQVEAEIFFLFEKEFFKTLNADLKNFFLKFVLYFCDYLFECEENQTYLNENLFAKKFIYFILDNIDQIKINFLFFLILKILNDESFNEKLINLNEKKLIEKNLIEKHLNVNKFNENNLDENNLNEKNLCVLEKKYLDAIKENNLHVINKNNLDFFNVNILKENNFLRENNFDFLRKKYFDFLKTNFKNTNKEELERLIKIKIENFNCLSIIKQKNCENVKLNKNCLFNNLLKQLNKKLNLINQNYLKDNCVKKNSVKNNENLKNQKSVLKNIIDCDLENYKKENCEKENFKKENNSKLDFLENLVKENFETKCFFENHNENEIYNQIICCECLEKLIKCLINQFFLLKKNFENDNFDLLELKNLFIKSINIESFTDQRLKQSKIFVDKNLNNFISETNKPEIFVEKKLNQIDCLNNDKIVNEYNISNLFDQEILNTNNIKQLISNNNYKHQSNIKKIVNEQKMDLKVNKPPKSIFDLNDKNCKAKFENTEFEYGPGIVDKLKSRFLQYQQQLLTKNENLTKKLKRSSSLENMLNCGLNKNFKKNFTDQNALNSTNKLNNEIKSSKFINDTLVLNNSSSKFYTQRTKPSANASSRHCNNKIKSRIIERNLIDSNSTNKLTNSNTLQTNYFKNLRQIKCLRNGSCSSNSSSCSSSNNDEEDDDDLNYFTLPVLKRAKSMETLTMELRNHQFTYTTNQNVLNNDLIKNETSIDTKLINNSNYSQNNTFKFNNNRIRKEDLKRQDLERQKKCNQTVKKNFINPVYSYIKNSNDLASNSIINSTKSSNISSNKLLETNATVINSANLINSDSSNALTNHNLNNHNIKNNLLTAPLIKDCYLNTINSKSFTNNSVANSNLNKTFQQINSINCSTNSFNLCNSNVKEICQCLNNHAIQLNNNNVNTSNFYSTKQANQNMISNCQNDKNKELALEDELPKPNTVKLCKQIFESNEKNNKNYPTIKSNLKIKNKFELTEKNLETETKILNGPTFLKQKNLQNIENCSTCLNTTSTIEENTACISNSLNLNKQEISSSFDELSKNLTTPIQISYTDCNKEKNSNVTKSNITGNTLEPDFEQKEQQKKQQKEQQLEQKQTKEKTSQQMVDNHELNLEKSSTNVNHTLNYVETIQESLVKTDEDINKKRDQDSFKHSKLSNIDLIQSSTPINDQTEINKIDSNNENLSSYSLKDNQKQKRVQGFITPIIPPKPTYLIKNNEKINQHSKDFSNCQQLTSEINSEIKVIKDCDENGELNFEHILNNKSSVKNDKLISANDCVVKNTPLVEDNCEINKNSNFNKNQEGGQLSTINRNYFKTSTLSRKHCVNKQKPDIKRRFNQTKINNETKLNSQDELNDVKKDFIDETDNDLNKLETIQTNLNNNFDSDQNISKQNLENSNEQAQSAVTNSNTHKSFNLKEELTNPSIQRQCMLVPIKNSNSCSLNFNQVNSTELEANLSTTINETGLKKVNFEQFNFDSELVLDDSENLKEISKENLNKNIKENCSENFSDKENNSKLETKEKIEDLKLININERKNYLEKVQFSNNETIDCEKKINQAENLIDLDLENSINLSNNISKEAEMRSYTLPSINHNSSKMRKPVANIKPLIQCNGFYKLDNDDKISKKPTDLLINNNSSELKKSNFTKETKLNLLNKNDDCLSDKLGAKLEKNEIINESIVKKINNPELENKNANTKIENTDIKFDQLKLGLKKTQAPQPPKNETSAKFDKQNSAVVSNSFSPNKLSQQPTNLLKANKTDVTLNSQTLNSFNVFSSNSNNQLDTSIKQTGIVNSNGKNSFPTMKLSNTLNNTSSINKKISSVNNLNKDKLNSFTSTNLNGLNKNPIRIDNSQQGATSIVFDFRGTNVKANVAVRSRTASGIIVRSSQDDDDDFNYTGITDIPPPSGIVFDGENEKLEKSSLLTKRNKNLRIKFNELDDDVFEYPSEAFLMRTYDQNDFETDCKNDSLFKNDSKIDDKIADKNEEIKVNSTNDITTKQNLAQPPPVPKRSKNFKNNNLSSALKNNTMIGTFNGNLSSYKPNSLSSNFELGITKVDRTDEKLNKFKKDENIDETYQMLKPANSNEIKSFSTSTKASDLLF